MVMMQMAVEQNVNFRNSQLLQHCDAALAHLLVPAVDHPDLSVVYQDRFVRVPDVRKPDLKEFSVSLEKESRI